MPGVRLAQGRAAVQSVGLAGGESSNPACSWGAFMPCYLMRSGHIQTVMELPGLDGYELWDRARVIIRHPPRNASDSAPVQ
jgi:hypothetical protein